MRIHRAVPMLVAALTLAGGTAPAALAFDAKAPAAGPLTPSAPLTTSGSHTPGGSSEWLLGVGTASGIAVVAGGLAANRRRSGHNVARARRIGAAGKM
jgi:hypothetical protein